MTAPTEEDEQAAIKYGKETVQHAESCGYRGHDQVTVSLNLLRALLARATRPHD